ncbi:hypothetical protein AX15_002791 [Amanita polypyramis BW_CC]|nr:hypothetical protein AX15_002791 [Amanita polypyramis BW_CC]
MAFAFRRQPLKSIYNFYQLVTTLFGRIPWWILRSIPRSWRPRESWSLGRVLRVNLLRHHSEVSGRTGDLATEFNRGPNHLAILSGPGVNGVWVDAIPELIAGDLKVFADVSSVTSIPIPGYWSHKLGVNFEVASPPKASEKLIYCLHGGGYIHLSAHPSSLMASIPRGLLEFTDLVYRTFSIEYRLSSGEPFVVANPFPSALIDALAGYNYLVNAVGFAPSDIIICGDSAGGNLALALTRYLVENRNSTDVKLPAPPGGVILLSPWSDLSDFHEQPGSSMFHCSSSDFIFGGESYFYSKRAFLGPHGMEASETNRYISPACKYPSLKIDFHGFPRTFLVAGGAEVLLDQIRALKQIMVNDLGEGNGVEENEGKVRYLEAEDAIHDYLIFDWHEPERSSTLKEIADWIVLAP